MEDFQKRIVRAVDKYDRVTVKSCHDMGKTFTMAKLVLAFTSTFIGAKVITTAPTHNQVKRLLWSEIRAGFRKSKYPLGGRMLLTEWKLDEDWFAVGFTSRGDAGAGEGQGKASGFQGFHAPYLLIIFDEATGIPRSIWQQVEGMLTSAHVKFVCIGNPTSRQTDFFKTFSDPSFHKLRLSCFDSPNLIANGVTSMEELEKEISVLRGMNEEEISERMRAYKTPRPQLLGLKWVISMAIKWGVKHPLFVSKALGDFPEDDENILIPLHIVEASQAKWEDQFEWIFDSLNANNPYRTNRLKNMVMSRHWGVDCARYGADKTVIVCIENNVQVLREVMTKASLTEVAGRVTSLVNKKEMVRRETITVDGTGIGAGVVDILKENLDQKVLRSGPSIFDFIFGASCNEEEEREHYVNVKALMFDLLSDSMKEDLIVMDDNVYLEELPSIIYKFTSRGQLHIESKDEYKARTGLGSPDDADALALANFGRVYSSGVGDFTRDFVDTSIAKHSGHAPGLRTGDQW